MRVLTRNLQDYTHRTSYQNMTISEIALAIDICRRGSQFIGIFTVSTRTALVAK